MPQSERFFTIGRIHDGRFDTYRGVLLPDRPTAMQYMRDELIPRTTPLTGGWSVFEVSDVGITQTHAEDQQ